MKRFDIAAVGEILVDFVTVKGEDPGKLYLEGNAGGAVANALAQATKLGCQTAFIGKVGKDAFGDYLRANIEKTKVDTSGLLSGGQPTTLAMVALDAKGNRSFSFYRNQTADVMLGQQEIDLAIVEGCGIFHFGTVAMAQEPARSTVLYAAQKAKAAGAKISFDPNYRPFLWPNKDEAIEAINAGLALADYLKVSDEEALLVTGETDPEKAALALSTKYGFTFTAVTLGPKGCVGVSQSSRVLLPTYDVKTIDTTGAGDAFWGAVLYRLTQLGDEAIDAGTLEDVVGFGNAAGSLVTAAYGAIAPQPTEKEIRHCMKTVPLLK